MSQDLLIREERLTYSISQHELERRWSAVRRKMEAAGVDFLLMQSMQKINGYLRYLADIPGGNYPATLLFPLDGEMAIVSHGSKPPAPATTPAPPMRRGKWNVINLPSTPGISWQNNWHGKKVAEVIKQSKESNAVIGLVGVGYMSGALTESVRSELPSAKIYDASDIVDEVKMIKSEEEIKLIKQCADMHVVGLNVAKKAVRVGRTAREVIQDVRAAQDLMGSEDQEMIIWFGQPGSARYMQPIAGNVFIRRTFKTGDVLDFLIESCGPGGYWYNLRRTFVVGNSVPPEVKEAHQVCYDALKLLQTEVKTGASPAAVRIKNDTFLKGKGYPEELRILGHNQGLCLVERPVLDEEETAQKIEANMNFALHPSGTNKFASICLSDNFIVTNSGAVPVSSELYGDMEIAKVG